MDVTQAAVGLLTPSGKVPWRGAALVIVSPSGDDQVVVTVDGLPRARGPYRIALTDGHGHAVPVAVVRHLDKEGGAIDMSKARDLPEAEQFITKVVTLKVAKPTEVAQVLTAFSKTPNGVTAIDVTLMDALGWGKSQPGPHSTLSDFNGDGRSDILFQHDSGDVLTC